MMTNLHGIENSSHDVSIPMFFPFEFFDSSLLIMILSLVNHFVEKFVWIEEEHPHI